ncbi:MAG: tetratricopeptide repeat protein [Segetibacter sp.]|nr:tetratricopeptide repeat protein [Segetibacter sp.]
MPKLLLSYKIFLMKPTVFFQTLFAFAFSITHVLAQPGATIDLKKPAKYENRELAAEKTGDKKFTLPKRILNNTATHYNYYFNATNRLNDLVARAKAAYQDDYSQLLSYYNYTLDVTSQDKGELDSIIFKSTAGILLHDLRSDWVDNMYLLLGKAYFFRNDLDSAAHTLQYINYAFAPKEDGGYDIPIGSNASNESGEFSIATKEKRSVLKKVISRPPSRNESLLWQVRSYIEMGLLPEASGVLEILRNDPNFPARLRTNLHETIGYWFYKQQVYDSAAFHLSKALNEADNQQEKARWEYLIAQMYQLSNDNGNAVEYYNRSIKHTTDPVLEVFARLNSIRVNGSDKKDQLQANINALLAMARKDKYESYRDIIYYAAANIELERKNYANAQSLLLKSLQYSSTNPVQKNQAFLLLGDLNFDRKAYLMCASFYDSVDVNSLAKEVDRGRINDRKPALKTIAENMLVVQNQDSLQALAKLPAEQRDAIIKKTVRQLRKAQGLKDEGVVSSNPAVRTVAPDLFAGQEKSSDFYFYNSSLKSRGLSEFKGKWGDRPNVDNWRRQSALQRQAFAASQDPGLPNADTVATVNSSFDGMLNTLPLTAEQVEQSNQAIMNALFNLGKNYSLKLEDYPSAIAAYEELLRRFPNTPNKEEALFNLVYAYDKTGDVAKANQYRNHLIATGQNKWVDQIKKPASAKGNSQANAATKKYEDIYNLFIEGKFEQAKNEKKAADALYGNSYWNPQLLFIEAIYYIKQKEDSTAIRVLTDMTKLYASNPLAERAKTMIDVLKRRKEIEDYLTDLDVSAPSKPMPVRNLPATQNMLVTNVPKPTIVTPAPVDKPIVANPVTNPPVVKTEPIKKDTIAAAPIVVKKFTFTAADPHYVVLLMDHVDNVYITEARNAFNRFNKEKYYNQRIDLSSVKIDDRYTLVLQGPFADANAAVEYIEKVKPQTSGRILPWLSVDKYSYIVISNANLDVLKSNKDMMAYQQLLQQAFPGKF